jgi:3' exoribonuclease, RNase T-like
VRYFYDTEFLEDGKTIELISIGIVAEDGREYYAVNRDAPWKRIKKHEWLMANVVPSLPQPHGDWRNHMPKSWLVDFQNPAVCSREGIAEQVERFLLGDDLETYTGLELWANYGAYDHVVLCQLFGPMVGLPPGIPMFTHDVMQFAAGRELPKQSSGVHNALADARHVKTMLESL